MVNPFSPNDRKVRDAQRNWIYKEVEPDIFAVCTVYQGIWHDNGRFRTYQAGDEITYEKMAIGFRHRLSKVVYRNCYKRHKKLIDMSGSLEGNGDDRHYHFNFFIKRPEWWTFRDFETLFKETWSKYDWAHKSPKYAVKFQERTGDCVGYGLKEGSQTLLVF